MNELQRVTHVQNIRYDREAEELYIIDQTKLPNEEVFMCLKWRRKCMMQLNCLK